MTLDIDLEWLAEKIIEAAAYQYRIYEANGAKTITTLEITDEISFDIRDFILSVRMTYERKGVWNEFSTEVLNIKDKYENVDAIKDFIKGFFDKLPPDTSDTTNECFTRL
jgi:hypothetical protein